MAKKLCLGLNEQFGAPPREQMRMMREAGFDAVFLAYKDGETVRRQAREAREFGLEVQSVHAPFGGCRALWEADEEAAGAALKEIADCIHICGECGIPITVSHAFIGFDIPPIPKERGLERYGRLTAAAAEAGVTLAFENTEGEEYLAALFTAYGNEKHVRFCLDTGHELCYNRGADLLARWGGLLAATHLNDNLGVKDPTGRITWHDDLHLLPFDGVRDWEETARRFARAGYTGTLTFELNTLSKPGRHENDAYAAMPTRDFIAESYARARRFAALLETAEKSCNPEKNMIK